MTQMLSYPKLVAMIGLSACYSLVRASQFPERIVDPRMLALNKFSIDGVRRMMFFQKMKDAGHVDSGKASSRDCECIPYSQPHLHPDEQKFEKNRPWYATRYGWLGRRSRRRWFFNTADHSLLTL